MVNNYKIDSQFHGEITCSLVGNNIKVHTIEMQERPLCMHLLLTPEKRVTKIPEVNICSYSGKMLKLRKLPCHRMCSVKGS
jgi:hypothetical protein